MRPRYATQAIVLMRSPLAEASAYLHLLTRDFGLARVRAQGVRNSGAKLAGALQTFVECDALLVRGKEGWRLSGALLTENRYTALSASARMRAGRVSELVLRLVQGELKDPELFDTFQAFLTVLPTLSPEQEEAAEIVVVLRLLSLLGLAEEESSHTQLFEASALDAVLRDRRSYILRINRGIAASGL